MFGVSGGELIILLLIGLVVLGPERLPRVANQIGSWLGQARRMTRVMKRQLEDELDLKDLNIKSLPSLSEPSSQSKYTPPRNDDAFSPAHTADETGVSAGDEIYDNDEDLAVTEVDRDLVADGTREHEKPPADDDAEEKATS